MYVFEVKNLNFDAVLLLDLVNYVSVMLQHK